MKTDNGPIFMVVFPIVLLLIGFCILVLATSCTLCLQNISTNGRADDVVDDNQSANPNIAPNINVPEIPF